MILRNISTRTITLRDETNQTYIVPAMGDLIVDDDLWGDLEFRRWLRLRNRDIEVQQTALATPGGAPDSATFVTTTASAGLTNEQLLSVVVGAGTLASRPAAGVPGRLYFVTDSNNQRVTRDTGSTWVDHTTAWGYVTNLPTSFVPSTHQTSHQTGQADALSGNINATARVNALKDGVAVGTRRGLNFRNFNAVTEDGGNERIDITNDIPLVTSLPGSPYDGQEVVYLADSANGITWHLKYRSASASTHKWEFIGGSPLISMIDTSEAITTTWQNLATDGPSITIPRAGDYRLNASCQGSSNYGNGSALQIGIAEGNTTPFVIARDGSWTNETVLHTYASAAITDYRRANVAASAILKMRYEYVLPMNAYNRYLSAVPIRVS